MILGKIHVPSIQRKRSGGPGRRQSTLPAVALALLLAGCAAEDAASIGRLGAVEGYLGGVVADEPQAALIGRDVLSAGGSAADAAVAMYFASAVTLPSAASLGGGGVCVAFDAGRGEARALEFLARAPRRVAADADRPTAIPGNVRGFFLLHARYGRLTWSQVLGPAESLARDGIRVSRAFASDLGQVADALLAEPETRRVFAVAGGGRIVGEGDVLRQPELASVLSMIRIELPGRFYTGPLAATLAAAAAEAGGSLDTEDLRDYRPVWRDPISLPFDNEVVLFAPPPPPGGLLAAQLWTILTERNRYRNAPAAERPHLRAEAMLRAYADRTRWRLDDEAAAAEVEARLARPHIDALMADYRPDVHRSPTALGLPVSGEPENPSAATFLAVDRKGSAVACAVTLNSLFGTGRVAAGTGIVLASLPGPGGRGARSLAPMLVVNRNVNEFHFAAAAAGGVAAPPAMIDVAARVLVDGEPLDEALAARRVFGSGDPDLVFVERGFDAAALAALAERGHRLGETPALGRVNAIACPGGAPTQKEACSVKTDPRGFGLAAGAD
ncbi:MAG: gamma-glutamyltransferase [Rhodospirillales bacterium]